MLFLVWFYMNDKNRAMLILQPFPFFFVAAAFAH